jgi:hypothetical protein
VDSELPTFQLPYYVEKDPLKSLRTVMHQREGGSERESLAQTLRSVLCAFPLDLRTVGRSVDRMGLCSRQELRRSRVHRYGLPLTRSRLKASRWHSGGFPF